MGTLVQNGQCIGACLTFQSSPSSTYSCVLVPSPRSTTLSVACKTDIRASVVLSSSRAQRPFSAQAAWSFIGLCSEGILFMCGKPNGRPFGTFGIEPDKGFPICHFHPYALADPICSLHIQMEQPGHIKPQHTFQGCQVVRAMDRSMKQRLRMAWGWRFEEGIQDVDHLPFVVIDNILQSLDLGEDIGAEHGEGFETFRPQGPLKVDVDYLNDRMRQRGLQRIRYAMKPDEAFGLIYSWDNVLADTRALRLETWKQLAYEQGKKLLEDDPSQRKIICMGTEYVLRKVLFWGETNCQVRHLKERLVEIYNEKLSKISAPREGLKEWLEALQTVGVPCAVASSLDRFKLLAALQRMGLYKYFQAVVTHEDGMDSMAHRFLSAAVKLDRPPSKCVVFEDDPRGITAAHNCSMKAVALIGSHPAYELTQADLAVSSFSELSVINLRRLFANLGAEFMDLQRQTAERMPPKRKIATDTFS